MAIADARKGFPALRPDLRESEYRPAHKQEPESVQEIKHQLAGIGIIKCRYCEGPIRGISSIQILFSIGIWGSTRFMWQPR